MAKRHYFASIIGGKRKNWKIIDNLGLTPNKARIRAEELSLDLRDDPCPSCGKDHLGYKATHTMLHGKLSPKSLRGAAKELPEPYVHLAEEARISMIHHGTQFLSAQEGEFCTDQILLTQLHKQYHDFIEHPINAYKLGIIHGVMQASLNRSLEDLGFEYLRAFYPDDHPRIWHSRKQAYLAGHRRGDWQTFGILKNYSSRTWNTPPWSKAVELAKELARIVPAESAMYNIELDKAAQAVVQAAKEDTAKSAKTPIKGSSSSFVPLQGDGGSIGKPSHTLTDYRKRKLITSEASLHQRWEELRNSRRIPHGRTFYDLNDRWGTLQLRHPALTQRRMIKFRKRAVDVGDIPRNMHRLPVDKAVFGQKRAFKKGTILIDCSGSMSLSQEAILAIIDAVPLATVALYMGNPQGGIRTDPLDNEDPWPPYTGRVYVVAKDGRMLSRKPFTMLLENAPGGNVVDGPALLWLADQAAPRIWVSDGFVTGIGDTSSFGLRGECEDIQELHLIRRIHPNVELRNGPNIAWMSEGWTKIVNEVIVWNKIEQERRAGKLAEEARST